MTTCRLEVELDPRPGEVGTIVRAPGEALSGSVVVEVTEPVRCKCLELSLELVRRDHHGEGGSSDWTDLQVREGVTRLFTGTWAAGTHRYPFEVPAPSIPSYDGQKVSFAWEVRARAGVSSARALAAHAGFTIAAPVRSHDDIVYEPLPPVAEGAESLKATLFRYAFPALTVAPLGFAAGLGIQLAMGIDPPSGAIGALASVGALGLLGVSFARARERARRGVVELDVRVARPAADYRTPDASAPTLEVTITAPSGEPVEHVEVELVVVEETAHIDRSGSGPASYSPVRTRLYEVSRRLEPSDAYHASLPLPAPGTAPLGTGRDRRGRGVYWQVEARVARRDGDEEWARAEVRARPATAHP